MATPPMACGGLDGAKAADDGIARSHTLSADGQGDGHDDRKALGYRGHRHADNGHERIVIRVTASRRPRTGSISPVVHS